MVAGYLRRTEKSAVYFREIYALLFNINRGEKTPAISGKDVLRLHSEKATRQLSSPKPKKRTKTELDDLVSRIRQS